MIQKLRYILLILAAVIGGESWAADNWGHVPITYSEFILGSKNVWSQSTNWDDRRKEISFSGIPQTLSFDYERSVSIASDIDWFVEVSVDGQSWERIKSIDNSEKGSVSIELASTIRYVCLIYSGNYGGYFRNISITERRYLTSDKPSLDFGSLNTNVTSTPQTVTISHCNAGSGVTVTSNHAKFKVSKSSLSTTGTDKMGTEQFTVTYDNTEVGNHSGTITVSDPSGNNAEISIPVKGVATKEKATPIFTWNLSNVATGREYADFFTSTNTDTPVSFVSGDASIANVVDGTLVTYAKEGSVSITVTQQGNDDWREKSATYTINVSKPQDHLPLAITESNWSVLTQNIQGGSFGWDGGVQHHSYAYGNREFEIAFQGIPDKLTFDHRVTDSNIDSSVKWTVTESSNGSDFTEAWSTGTNNGSASVQLKPSSRYVRIKCYCIYYENVSNIQITELRYLNASPTSIDFGENVEGDAVTKTFTLRHANAGYGVTLVSSNPDAFEVSPSTLTTTGGDKMGEGTITVTYKNNTVGEHSGTITIADPNGTNAPVSVDLSATTISSGLILNPTQTPDYDVRTYKRVVLQRTLPMGYSTITLPFTYNIGGVEGGYVAQLELVTHNQQDGYTLYFKKVSDGIMHPHQPYVVYLPIEIANPEWGETAVSSPDAQNIQKAAWTMQANYTPGVSMEGKYGIVGGKLCLGGAGSTINAYTAYFIPPAEAKGRVRVAMLDNDGTTTYIHSLSDTESDKETTAIYRLDGTKQTALTKGINIVRMQDGSVRKVLK